MSSGLSFVITEAEQDTASANAPVRFEWNATNRAAPRGPWPGGIHIRTAKDESPGTAEIVEQVLGPSWSPFSLSGVWDDRYGGQGFAQRTLDEFRALVARAPLCEIVMGVESVVGLIDDFQFERRRLRPDGTWWMVSYTFTVTPHLADNGVNAQPIKSVPSESPSKLVAQVSALQEPYAEAHARAPRQALTGITFAQVNTEVERTLLAIQRTSLVVDTRYSPTITPTAAAGAARTVSAFLDVAAGARATLDAVRALDPVTALAFETVATSDEYCGWTLGLQSTSLLLAGAARRAAFVLSRRLLPDGIAVYRPTASELLASISLRYYGTAHRWREIMRRNRLRSPLLTGDELLIIPR